jgi:hypothetical protein
MAAHHRERGVCAGVAGRTPGDRGEDAVVIPAYRLDAGDERRGGGISSGSFDDALQQQEVNEQ